METEDNIIVNQQNSNSESAILNEKIDELSLLLVMLDLEDSVGYEAALESLRQIILAINIEENQRIKLSASQILEKSKTKPKEEIYENLKDFAAASQAFLANAGNSLFPNEVDSKLKDSAPVEVVEEKLQNPYEGMFSLHLDLVNDIKNQLSEIQLNVGTPKEIVKESVENYFLKLLSDCRELGIDDLSEVAEKVFISVNTEEIDSLVDPLMSLSEWILTTLQLLASGTDYPKEERLKAALSLLSARITEAAPVLAEVKTAIVEDVPVAAIPVAPIATPAAKEESPKSQDPAEFYIIEADAEMLSEFIAEAEDHLQAVESILLERQDGFSPEDIDTVFRGVHSLKGTSSYFNLKEINESSHLLENILDEARSGKRTFCEDLKELVLRYVDIEKRLLKVAQKALNEGGRVQRDAEVTAFVIDVKAFFEGKPMGAAAPKTIVESAPVESKPAIIPEIDKAPTKALSEEIHVESSEVNAKEKSSGAKANNQKENAVAKTFVKIDTERLDSLGEMIGEMVIYSSMLVRKCRESMSTDEDIMRMSDQVEKFSRELQDIGMSMRLDPVKGLFQKLSRLVWDTSKKLGKEISFQLKGEDTELDRNVIERLGDPLMHMVRNSLDHGIEMPNDREALGKPRAGLIELSASHEGGNIVITIRDDGKGLDPKKLLAKAIEKEIIDPSQKLTDQEIMELIFAPGFSTAEKVTDISGRGVGMDVVRNNIEGMRGRVRIKSVLGEGTTFTIELPLTLAIIEGIEALVGKEKFILPTLSIVELMRPTPEMIGTTLHSGETFHFRGRHLPLFRLSEVFNIEDGIVEPSDGIITIVENSGEQVAFLIDGIIGSCQTVIKNLGPMFESQKGVAGCAIMPNGDIGLIIDVRSLVQVARDDTSTNSHLLGYVSNKAEVGGYSLA